MAAKSGSTPKGDKPPAQKPQPPKRRLFGRIDAALEPVRESIDNSAVLHFIAIMFAVLTGVVTIGTMWQITTDISDRQTEREEAREERLSRAWAHLMTPVGGQSGKGAAMNVILLSGGRIDQVELSCRKIGDWDQRTGKCANPPVLDGVAFGISSRGNIFDWGTKNFPLFSDITFTNSDFSGVSLYPRDFANVRFEASNLEGATIHEDAKVSLFAVSLKRAKIYYEADVAFAENISNAIFFFEDGGLMLKGQSISAPAAFAPEFSNAWFWADEPPVLTRSVGWNDKGPTDTSFLDRIASNIRICDPKFRVSKRNADAKGQAVAGETYPQISTGDLSCPELSLDEARKQFPAKYPVVKPTDL
ncbi:hypothetical protein JJB09_24905 [Rhizobium sp. KVB221]|uniref:Pentapeptide repeat-containing protein n=1 Tax=Rhizobium setariae TaxID=2801340 RepID=A0A936YUX8_9HYPH|nr:hypothetical protein [Rhizobium setariae]MBL0375259.1 hypothetical protein [Rhizobium setariae]